MHVHYIHNGPSCVYQLLWGKYVYTRHIDSFSQRHDYVTALAGGKTKQLLEANTLDQGYTNYLYYVILLCGWVPEIKVADGLL